MKHIGTQRLLTERLLLRPFVAKDYLAMYRNWASEPDNLRHVTWSTHENTDVTKQSVAQWVQQYQDLDFYKWAICLKENSGEVIGDISVVDIDEDINACEVGYVLSKRYWGRGLMTEALQEVLSYLLKEADFNRVTADFVTDNPASGRVMAKAGMIYEATFRKAVFHKGKIKDFSSYGILKSDLQ